MGKLTSSSAGIGVVYKVAMLLDGRQGRRENIISGLRTRRDLSLLLSVDRWRETVYRYTHMHIYSSCKFIPNSLFYPKVKLFIHSRLGTEVPY